MSSDRKAVSGRAIRSRRVAPAGAGEPTHALVEGTLNLPVSDPFRNRKDGNCFSNRLETVSNPLDGSTSSPTQRAGKKTANFVLSRQKYLSRPSFQFIFGISRRCIGADKTK